LGINYRIAQTILVVDDEPQIANVLRGYLERAGFRVVTANDSQLALTQCKHEKPDLRAEAVDGLRSILLNPQRIAQILGNLIGNAIRHTPESGAIRVRCSLSTDHHLLFTLSDTGSGIPPSHYHTFSTVSIAWFAHGRGLKAARVSASSLPNNWSRRMADAFGPRANPEKALPFLSFCR